MTSNAAASSFLLIDGSQLAVAELPVPAPDDRPAWLTHIYDDNAAAVSPLVIDMEAADSAGACEQIAGLANAMRPQAHASFIDTTLSHAALTHHLRRFMMIRTMEGEAYTLRFADCTVLPMLFAVLAPSQWAALVGPIARWCVHGRDGALSPLPPADDTLAPAPTPLVLTGDQVHALREASAPATMLAFIRANAHGVTLPGTHADQHRLASEARVLWQAAGNSDEVVLRWLTRAALDTAGAVLLQPRLSTLLGSPDVGAIRAELRRSVGEQQRAKTSGRLD